MLRAHHPTGTSRDEGPRSANGGRAVYALICEKCGRAVVYGDTPVNGEPGYACREVPLARVHHKPACVCGMTHYAPAQSELFVEVA